MGALEKEIIYHCYEDALESISLAGGIAVNPRPDIICQMAAENTESLHFCIKYCQLSPAAYDRMGRSLFSAAIHANNEETMLMLIDMLPAEVLNKPMEVSNYPFEEISTPTSIEEPRIEEVTDLEAQWIPPTDHELWAWHPLHWIVKFRQSRVFDAMVRKYVQDHVHFPEWIHGPEYKLRMCQFIHPSTAEYLFHYRYNISSELFIVPRLEIPASGRHYMTMTAFESLWDDYNDPQDVRRNPGPGYRIYIESYLTSSWHEATKHPLGKRFMAWLALRSELSMYTRNSKDHTPLHHAALGNDVSGLDWLCKHMDLLHVVRVKQPDNRPDKVFNSIVLAAFSRSWNSVKVFETILRYSPEDYANNFQAAKSVFLAIIYGTDHWLVEEPPEYAGFQTGPIPAGGLRLPTPRQLATQKFQVFVSRLPISWNGSIEQMEVVEEAKIYGFDFLQHSVRTPRAATRSMTRIEEEIEMQSEREAEWEAQSNHPDMGELVKVAKMAQQRGKRINTPKARRELEEEATRAARERAETKRQVQRREEARSWGGTWQRIMEGLGNMPP